MLHLQRYASSFNRPVTPRYDYESTSENWGRPTELVPDKETVWDVSMTLRYTKEHKDKVRAVYDAIHELALAAGGASGEMAEHGS